MADHRTVVRLEDHWGSGPAAGADDLAQIVYLSHLVGREPRLVQPGGGNTSIKAGDVLLVKGSGTDLSSITGDGFTRLSLAGLGPLRTTAAMDDAEMMRLMARAMVAEGPAPSVETPLHALLPHRVIVHTHDVATMSLTNVREGVAERIATELFGGEIAYVPYVRPGFPLAQAVGAIVDGLPAATIGLLLAHHGLVVWGDDPRACYARLLRVVNAMEEYAAAKRRAAAAPRAGAILAADVRGRGAEALLPPLRGALGAAQRVVLHFDDSDGILTALANPRLAELARRGMATPEHILRAGRLPLWLDVEVSAPGEAIAAAVRTRIAEQRAEYDAYHARHAGQGERTLDDWAKVVLVPGIGMITASRDKRNAVTANVCYRAALEAIVNAESIDRFESIAESEVFEFEHWPLERRKVDEQDARDRARLLLHRRIALVIGAGSGIGQAAVRRFVEEGAHVVAADLDGAAAESVAREVDQTHPGRAVGVALDVRDDASIAGAIRRTVLEFGGLDCLFYTAGRAPRFAAVTEITREDLRQQLDVHYVGAVLALGAAARVMRAQGTGGAIILSVSKAALAPGRDAAAYGGSKAALLQAMRVAALELGADGIRVNAINADQIDTPMFSRFVAERAAMRGVSAEEQLETYRRRNVMGVSLIPANAVADMAALLAGERFRYTTGDIITIDGGLPEAFPR